MPGAYDYLDSIYSDLNFYYGEDGKPAVLRGLDAINQSISMVITTYLRSRYRRPMYGSELPAFLQDNFTPNMVVDMKNVIFLALQKWEPRIRVNRNEIKVERLDADTSVINISFPFVIPAANTDSKFSQQFTVEGLNDVA
ncbi:MAG: GPW/gp25 family protein [Balneolaceae bacterium]